MIVKDHRVLKKFGMLNFHKYIFIIFNNPIINRITNRSQDILI